VVSVIKRSLGEDVLKYEENTDLKDETNGVDGNISKKKGTENGLQM
jgi:hypothetical protein